MAGGALTIPTPIKPPTPEEERARAVWLLAADLASEEGSKVGFLRILAMPGKRGRGSGGDLTDARRLALYLATTVGNVSIRPLGKAAGVHPSTVAHHVELLGDLRDDNSAFDALLEQLERRLVWRAACIVVENLRYSEGAP